MKRNKESETKRITLHRWDRTGQKGEKLKSTRQKKRDKFSTNIQMTQGDRMNGRVSENKWAVGEYSDPPPFLRFSSDLGSLLPTVSRRLHSRKYAVPPTPCNATTYLLMKKVGILGQRPQTLHPPGLRRQFHSKTVPPRTGRVRRQSSGRRSQLLGPRLGANPSYKVRACFPYL